MRKADLLFSIAFLANLLSASASLAADASGEAVYDKWCSHCHGPESQEHPGTIALLTKYQGNLPADIREREDLTEESVSFYVRNGISVMPFFRKTEINDSELEALSRYIVNYAGQ